jgi:hypothetical protein
VCALVTHLPQDAAVWQMHNPRAGWTRAELLAAATERRLTALWATVATMLGQEVTDEQLADPLDVLDPSVSVANSAGESGPKTLREIAIWMRNS